ncbi:hypothetical protein LC605_32960 [Nostoc sp. CHAB 5836]|uniref:hypothetical protein n=1 Tax=Nostoc sp. CHAB 5836 TaxID=2780404 RepID=UPI001E58D75C|nr:hypothetical protein [Nostoc sp. CHAB 5836]MCC5619745.1 hypothetical protein [Nostoc sp. CHAB 5836]
MNTLSRRQALIKTGKVIALPLCPVPVCARVVDAQHAGMVMLGEVGPYVFRGGDGVLEGVLPTLLKMIKPRLPFNFSIVGVAPMERLVSIGGRASNTVLMPVIKIPTREESLKWLERLFDVRYCAFASSGRPVTPQSIGALSSYRIGAVRAEGLQQWAASIGINVQQVVANNRIGLSMLKANRFDLFLAPAEAAWFSLRHELRLPHREIVEVMEIARLEIYAATSLDSHQPICAAWKSAIRSAQGTREWKKYFFEIRELYGY